MITHTPNLVAQETWRGLTIALEYRCTPYSKKQYPYSQRVESRIIAEMGAIYGPYEGVYFHSAQDTDIEHIVATSEAHDSGLCAASDDVKRQFASDTLNLTLASPQVNRHQKSGLDAGEWLPDFNRCWFANRVVQVKRKYNLTVDIYEAQALEDVLYYCTSTEMMR